MDSMPILKPTAGGHFPQRVDVQRARRSAVTGFSKGVLEKIVLVAELVPGNALRIDGGIVVDPDRVIGSECLTSE